MSEKELGKALLNLDALALAGVPDARQQTWLVLERDRRRVRRLTALTVLVWVLAMLLALAAICTVRLVFASRRATLRQLNASLLEVAEQLKRLRPAP